MKSKESTPITGMVTSRKCPFCGHSEIGYTTQDGEFHALKPGTLIRVSETAEAFASEAEAVPSLDEIMSEEEGDPRETMPWVPEPLRGNRYLRQKYGIFAKVSLLARPMTGDTYRVAYIKKLEKLIAKEIHTPLPVIFDRFFSAPHLASGNPRQIAQAVWLEIDEVQGPVRLVSTWLEKGDEESLAKMVHPKLMEELTGQAASEEEVKKDLDALSLEEFLGML